jgi:hypothetical protein
MGHESRIEPWSPHLTAFCFAGFGTDRLRREDVMKTAGRENSNRWGNASSNRVLGAEVQNRSCSVMWAAKQEKIRPLRGCFFLTSPFIELIRSWLTFQRVSRKYLNLRDDVSDLFPRAAVDKHPTQSRVPIVLKSRAKEASYKALPFA